MVVFIWSNIRTCLWPSGVTSIILCQLIVLASDKTATMSPSLQPINHRNSLINPSNAAVAQPFTVP